MSIPREAQKQEKKQFQKKRKNTGENPGVGVCFWSNFHSPAKHTACILI